MAACFSEKPRGEEVRCPVCRAVQPWSDTCRRCKCDLAFLRSVAEACRDTRRRFLRQVRAGRPADALREARRIEALDPGEESDRLLAVAYLLCEDWEAALKAAKARGAF